VRTNVLYDYIHNHSLITRSFRRHTRGGITTHNESLVNKLRNEIFTSNSVVNNSKAYSGELRSIIVMFINIDMKENNTLFVDPDAKHVNNRPASMATINSANHSGQSSGASFSAAAAAVERLAGDSDVLAQSRHNSTSSNGSAGNSFLHGANSNLNQGLEDIDNPQFHFLRRSALEKEKDDALCSRFQQCMEIMTSVFSKQGGQMRQFIVDDKGTVCIGTFGLKGAVNNDNAAAALQAGQSIIIQLKKIGKLCASLP
jgi:hypothetical protein